MLEAAAEAALAVVLREVLEAAAEAALAVVLREVLEAAAEAAEVTGAAAE